MRWIMYVGPSPSRDVPGVGEMKHGEPVLIDSAEVAERLLGSTSFVEFSEPKVKDKPAKGGAKED